MRFEGSAKFWAVTFLVRRSMRTMPSVVPTQMRPDLSWAKAPVRLLGMGTRAMMRPVLGSSWVKPFQVPTQR